MSPIDNVSRRSILRNSALLVTAGAVGATTVSAAGSDDNDDNRENERPHVNIDVDGTEVTLEFVNPTEFAWSFDYRVDGEPEGTEDQWTGDTISEGPLEGEDFGLRYEPVTLVGEGSETVTVTATELVEVRLARGAEQMWYFDWIEIAVEQPETKADCKQGGFADYGFRNQGQCIRYVNTGKDSR